MLINIKSTYTIKLIFSLVTEEKKLRIVKYNTVLLNILNLNWFNYAFFGRKYLEYQSNGKVKIYHGFNLKLNYDGEYLNGKRHGKGKEYSYGNLIYEGEFLIGKRNGTGKEYFYSSSPIFEGEYLNGKRHGKGKEYRNYPTQLKFEGDFLNGIKWKGKGYNYNGEVIYELNNQINGKFVEYNYDNELLFDGELLNNKKNGKGKEYFRGKLIFEGEYLNDKRNGQGKEFDIEKKYIFEGDFLNDLKWNGKLYNNNGEIIYEIKDGKCENVKEYNEYGYFKFEGEYLNGQRNSKGIEYRVSYKFEGEYLNGERNIIMVN